METGITMAINQAGKQIARWYTGLSMTEVETNGSRSVAPFFLFISKHFTDDLAFNSGGD